MKITYRDKRFRAPTLDVIDQANEILDEYAAQGFDLTLRQLYYQFVARGLIANSQKEYKRLGSTVNDGRLAGLIDWDRIVDRTRNLKQLGSWQSPADYLMPDGFHMSMWETQGNYCEVWIEKEALVGVISGVCSRWDVPYFACRGYVSQSESWRAAQRIGSQITLGKAATVFHLGDHDPSGIDMTRDNQDRLTLFEALGANVERLALNMDQVERWNPPPNPAKLTDSRCAGYAAKFGDQSWELDALQPKEIERLIEKNIKGLINKTAWRARTAETTRGRRLLKQVKQRWDEVVKLMEE